MKQAKVGLQSHSECSVHPSSSLSPQQLLLKQVDKCKEQQPFNIYQMLANIKKNFHTPFTFPNSKVKIKIVLLLFKYI